MEDYMRNVFNSYLIDPADSEYQRAYLCGFLDMYADLGLDFMTKDQIDILEIQTIA